MPTGVPDGDVGLVLVAAGRGSRLGAGVPKALIPLGSGSDEAPLVVHALRGVLRCRAVTHVVVVAPPDPEGMRQLTAAIERAFPGLTPGPPSDRTRPMNPPDARPARIRVVPGGDERVDSVAAGLNALPPDIGAVLVHDAARVLTPVEVFDRVVGAVRSGHAAVTPALRVTDTVKQVEITPDGSETVVATVDRAGLRAIQTPQGFLRETLERAHAEFDTTVAATDDCGMVEATGGRVHVVPGDPRAMKVTTAHDLGVVAGWLTEEASGRESAGRDPSHQDAAGPALVVLGGLPGVGKTSVARELCRRVGAAHLRVDTIEQGLVRGGLPTDQLFVQGYAAAYAVATDQLAVGLSVVADMVNDVEEPRQQWKRVADVSGARLVRVLVECSDESVHRGRVEGRPADIEDHRLPTWADVLTREVLPWPEADVVVDTARLSPAEAAALIAERLA